MPTDLQTVRRLTMFLIGQTVTSSTYDPDLTTSQVDQIINNAIRWWYENNENRVMDVTLIGSPGVVISLPTIEHAADSSSDYPEIIHVYISNVSGYDSGEERVLEPLPVSEIFNRVYANPTRGVPSHYGLSRRSGMSPAAGTQGRWYISLYPLPDARYQVGGLVRGNITSLSGDTDRLDLGDYEARCVGVIAAIMAAPTYGRPDLVDDLIGFLPELVQNRIGDLYSKKELLTQ